MHLRTLAIPALLAATAIAAEPAERPQAPPIEVATVSMDRLTSDLDSERLRQLLMDKDTLDALRRINADLGRLKKELIEAADELKLVEIKKQIDFANQKISLLRDRSGGNRELNARKLATDFVIRRYAGRFSLIIQDSMNLEGRVLYKNLRMVDITDEAAEALRKDIAERLGEAR